VLDELDKKIIRILQRNARVPNTEIGRALDVTETTIRNRVSRLIDEKLIEIVAVVDPKATDATISAFLLLTVSPPEIGAALDQLRAGRGRRVPGRRADGDRAGRGRAPGDRRPQGGRVAGVQHRGLGLGAGEVPAAVVSQLSRPSVVHCGWSPPV